MAKYSSPLNRLVIEIRWFQLFIFIDKNRKHAIRKQPSRMLGMTIPEFLFHYMPEYQFHDESELPSGASHEKLRRSLKVKIEIPNPYRQIATSYT